jgi:hypothetical protein
MAWMGIVRDVQGLCGAGFAGTAGLPVVASGLSAALAGCGARSARALARRWGCRWGRACGALFSASRPSDRGDR